MTKQIEYDELSENGIDQESEVNKFQIALSISHKKKLRQMSKANNCYSSRSKSGTSKASSWRPSFGTPRV